LGHSPGRKNLALFVGVESRGFCGKFATNCGGKVQKYKLKETNTKTFSQKCEAYIKLKGRS